MKLPIPFFFSEFSKNRGGQTNPQEGSGLNDSVEGALFGSDPYYKKATKLIT